MTARRLGSFAATPMFSETDKPHFISAKATLDGWNLFQLPPPSVALALSYFNLSFFPYISAAFRRRFPSLNDRGTVLVLVSEFPKH